MMYLIEQDCQRAVDRCGQAAGAIGPVHAIQSPPIPIIDVATTILTHQWIEHRGLIHKPFDLDAVQKQVQRCLEE
jgi:hypothetical protein